ncbi:unnamed protein product [Boreogadus saida]
MRSVVWVNTLQVQVRVPALTANKKLRYKFESPHARLIRREYPQGARGLWVNTLQVQVRVPARTANKKLSRAHGDSNLHLQSVNPQPIPPPHQDANHSMLGGYT